MAIGISNRSSARRVIVIAVDGPLCVGKTSLCSALRDLLVDVRIVYQDECRITHLAVEHPIWRIKDTEDADQAIDWSAWRDSVDLALQEAHVAATHRPTPRFVVPRPIRTKSYEAANNDTSSSSDSSSSEADLLSEVAFAAPSRQPSPVEATRWRDRLRALTQQHIIVLLDGRLALYDPTVARRCDVRLYLRDDAEELRKRWLVQQASATPTVSTPSSDRNRLAKEWQRLIWPAHQRSHCRLFEEGDVERGAPLGDLRVVDCNKASNVLEAVCESLVGAIEQL